MKIGISLLISLFLISTSAFGALDTEDLEKIRGIFKESEDRLRAELVAVEKRLREELVAVETRLREEIALVRKENAASEARTGQQLNRNLTLFVALFGFIAVIIGIPLTLVMLQARKERDRDK